MLVCLRKAPIAILGERPLRMRGGEKSVALRQLGQYREIDAWHTGCCCNSACTGRPYWRFTDGAACPLWVTFASCPTGPKLDLRRTAGLQEKRPPSPATGIVCYNPVWHRLSSVVPPLMRRRSLAVGPMSKDVHGLCGGLLAGLLSSFTMYLYV